MTATVEKTITSFTIEQRLRRFLLLLSGSICLGTVVELLLAGHWGDLVQWIPFGLSALGLAAISAVWRHPQRKTILALRGVMVLVMLGSIYGVWEHLEGNLGFVREIKPNATTWQWLLGGLTGGNPLLAPGILALAALIALAASYYHPALGQRPDLPPDVGRIAS
jgi:ABC-type uncharacterized transport system permease subunit